MRLSHESTRRRSRSSRSLGDGDERAAVSRADAFLRLQRAIGNRATARLVARAPLDRDALAERVEHGAGSVGSPPEPARKASPASAEFEKLGDLTALMSEYVEEALFKKDLPSHLFNNLARAWDVYELYGFVKSGGTENQGDVVAIGGKAAHDVAQKRVDAAAKAAKEAAKIPKGAPGKQGAEAAAKVAAEKAGKRWVAAARWGGGVAAVVWTTYEAFALGAWLRARWDAQRRQAMRDRDAWRHRMMQHVWLDYLPELQRAREEKFDELMGGGGRMGWGQVPSLTRAAAKKAVQLMNEASDDWRVWLPVWERSAKFVAANRDADPETKTGADVARHKQQMKAVVDRLAGHFARIRDFETDPANWELTHHQRELLASSEAAIAQ